MYSLHPAGVPGGVWAGGGAVDDSDVVQLGWRSRLSTSFRAHWGVARAAPFPLLPSLLLQSWPSSALHLAEKKMCLHTHFPFGTSSRGFFATLLVCFFSYKWIFKLIKSSLLKPFPGYSAKQHCWRSFCFRLILYLWSLSSIIYIFFYDDSAFIPRWKQKENKTNQAAKHKCKFEAFKIIQNI